VMDGINDAEILPMCEMTRDLPITVRFIEEMPFNGSGRFTGTLKWNYQAIHKLIQRNYPDVVPLKSLPTSTAMNYHIPGHKGNIGIIAAYSRTFCGTCNRIRITPNGQMRTCLYGKNVLDLRQLVREQAGDDTILQSIQSAIQQRAKDGFEAEKLRKNQPITESMSTIGG